MHRIWKIGLLCMMLSLASCNVTRYLSDEETLLNTVKVRTVGEYRDVNTANLRNYVRQTPNSRWFSFVKLPLYTYSIAGSDTTRWLTRTLRSIGEAPVVFDSLKAELSRSDLH